MTVPVRRDLSETDQAERVANRIGEDAKLLAPTVKPDRSQSEGGVFCDIKIIDPNIQMHLLRNIATWPRGGRPVVRPLESQAGSIRRVTDDNPVTVVLNPNHAEQPLIELSKGTRIRTIDDKSVPASDHGRRLVPARARLRV
jgi:hypothetical protein